MEGSTATTNTSAASPPSHCVPARHARAPYDQASAHPMATHTPATAKTA